MYMACEKKSTEHTTERSIFCDSLGFDIEEDVYPQDSSMSEPTGASGTSGATVKSVMLMLSPPKRGGGERVKTARRTPRKPKLRHMPQRPPTRPSHRSRLRPHRRSHKHTSMDGSSAEDAPNPVRGTGASANAGAGASAGAGRDGTSRYGGGEIEFTELSLPLISVAQQAKIDAHLRHRVRFNTGRHIQHLVNTLSARRGLSLTFQQCIKRLDGVVDPCCPVYAAHGENRMSRAIGQKMAAARPFDRGAIAVAYMHNIGKVVSTGSTGVGPFYVFGPIRPVRAYIAFSDPEYPFSADQSPEDLKTCERAHCQGFDTLLFTLNHSLFTGAAIADRLQEIKTATGAGAGAGAGSGNGKGRTRASQRDLWMMRYASFTSMGDFLAFATEDDVRYLSDDAYLCLLTCMHEVRREHAACVRSDGRLRGDCSLVAQEAAARRSGKNIDAKRHNAFSYLFSGSDDVSVAGQVPTLTLPICS